MENSYSFLLVIAIILLSTKVLGLLSQKVHMPQVVGALLAGLILGPTFFGVLHETDFLIKAAEIGVIMLMFLAGLDTDLKELKATGVASLSIACIGVILPLLGGWAAYALFFQAAGADPMHMMKGIFIGVVLTATSVSITVETLREMGKLKTRMGTAILGAAIIDDILGIVALTVITSFAEKTGNAGLVMGKIVLYFIFVIAVGFIAYKVFKKMVDRYGDKRRISIYGFAFCLIMAYVAERYFGIADITGAYFAGIILCNIGARSGIAKKVTVASYMIFSPIFFASIGLKTQIENLSPKIIWFSLALLAVAIITKVAGGYIGAKLNKFGTNEALCIGIGMVSRGEVALIVAQKGLAAGLITAELFPPIVVVVIVTTLITPILLKLAYREKLESGKMKT